MVRVKQNICLPVLIIFIILVVFNFLNVFINMDYSALALYIAFLLFTYRVNKEIVIKYMFMYVMFTYHIMSVFVVENFPNYLYNLQEWSYRCGCFLPLLTSYMIGFMVLLLLETNSNSKLRKQSIENKLPHITLGKIEISEKKLVRIVTAILLLLTIFMIARIGKNGFYSMGGIDRFEYRANAFTVLDSKYYTYISWFLPIPLMCSNIGMKKRSWFFFGLYCFYLIWVGDKFGSLFLAFYFYLLVNWSTKKLDKKLIRKVVLLSVGVLAALMAFISYQVLYERGSWLEVLEYFNNRLIGGQSDLWWGVFSQENNGWLRVGEFINDELSAVITQPDNWMDYNFGIYKMMRVTAPDWVVNNYLNRGVRFAASTQASLFYYFKYTGLYLGSIGMFVLYYQVVNRAVNAYRNNDIIRAVCYTMLILKSIQLTTMSAIDMLGNVTTWLAIIILLFISQRKGVSFRNRGINNKYI